MVDQARVLIIDDDKDLANLVALNLAEAGFLTSTCADGSEGLEQALEGNFDLVILDVKLPGLGGFEVCQKLKQKKPAQRIIMLTSLGDEVDRVVGFERGADDYVIKPFSVRELVARVRALMKREIVGQSNSKEKDVLEFLDLKIDRASRRAFKGTQELQLTATEFDLIEFFLRNPDRAFSRTQLLQSVWKYDSSVYEHTVNSHINRLRGKIEDDAANPKYITTVWGIGYRLGTGNDS